MSPNEFLSASHLIFTSWQENSSAQAAEGNQTDFLIDLLRGYKGRDVQQVLLEVGIALERLASAAVLPGALKTIVYDFESTAFRGLNADGLYIDALTVLHERLLGSEGLGVLAKAKFAEIKVNVSHIGNDVSEEQGIYWRQRVKDFKYQTISELKNYVQASRAAIDMTANNFSAATSATMNKLLDLKLAAETQQSVLIKARTDVDTFSGHDLAVLNYQLLADYLLEAAAGSNSVLFARRLHAMIDKCLSLKVFEEPYMVLSAVSGQKWQQIRQVSGEFETEIESILAGCTKVIEELIDVMDYANLPDNLEIDNLIEPFFDATKSAFEKVKSHTGGWLQTVRDIQTKLEQDLHPA